MKKFITLMFLIVIVTVAINASPDPGAKESDCKCPTVTDLGFPRIFCGKEINAFYKNNRCQDETKYRCKGAGKQADVKRNCRSIQPNAYCGREFTGCSTNEDCLGEKHFRMCFTVDDYDGAASRCHRKHYVLDKDKSWLLCCDQELSKYVNPKCPGVNPFPVDSSP